MDNGLSTIRNLLYVVLGLTVLSILANFYVGSELARNSNELDGLRQVLAKEMMGTVLEQSQQLNAQLQQLNDQAGGIDEKMKKAQDAMVERMQKELPRMMDAYVRNRMPQVEREAMKQLPQQIPH